MTRIASKLLLGAAILSGLVVAGLSAANLNAATDSLPAVPTATAPATVTAPVANSETVVDLTDWQTARITVGGTSNSRR